MILKFIILKQAYTITIYNLLEKNYIIDSKCLGEFFVEIILKSKNCKWVENSKN